MARPGRWTALPTPGRERHGEVIEPVAVFAQRLDESGVAIRRRCMASYCLIFSPAGLAPPWRFTPGLRLRWDTPIESSSPALPGPSGTGVSPGRCLRWP